MNVDEAAGVLPVVVYKLVTDPKDVHLASYQDTNGIVPVTVARTGQLARTQ